MYSLHQEKQKSVIFYMFFSKKKSILGIDIGTANIKIAQIKHDKSPVLETYGIVNLAYQHPDKNDTDAIQKMANVLKDLLTKASVTTNRCVISFPNSSVFTSVIELPKMSSQEMGSAVEFEAKKYVPLELSEVELSWSVISAGIQQNTQKVLLTAVPKQIKNNYMQLFDMAGLEPEVAEIEALALIRSLIGNEQLNCVIIDIGAKSTGINIVEKGLLRLSRNLNVGGDTITDKIAEGLRITRPRAEQFKRDFGVTQATFIPETIKPVLGSIKNEIKQLLTIYQTHNSAVDSLMLVGGGANLPGISDYFADLNVPVKLGDPLKSVAYNQSAAPILKRYSLSLPIAIGLAMRVE